MDKIINVTEQKSTLRAEKTSALLSLKDRVSREKLMTKKVLSFVKNNGYKKVAIYNSIRTEVSTKEIIKSLLSLDVSVFIPVVTSESEMIFTRIDKNTEYKNGAFGVQEPTLLFPETNFDVMFVPLVAYDKNHNRLGKGKGYYDRYLSSSNYKKIGLAFLEQESKSVPVETTDIPLDEIFTV